MMADDVNDIFAEIAAGIGDIADPEDMPDYTAMDRVELMQNWLDVKKKLVDHQALMQQTTEEDQDLASRYYGLLLEMKRRRIDP